MTFVLETDQNGVRILTLNRSEKRNAANLDMQRLLLDRLRAAAGDPATRAIVLTGAGQAFCAGGDFEMIKALQEGQDISKEAGPVHDGITKCLLSLEIPSIAAVNGPAVGFGAELVALCDLVVMGEDAFLCDPHVKHGIGAAPGLQLMWPLLTSRAIAKELLLTGRRVGAEEAVRIGLANRVVASGEELATAVGLAEEIAGLPRSGVAAVKRAFNQSLAEGAGTGAR